MSVKLHTVRSRLQISLGLTIFLVIIELSGGIISNSISLVSDAGHVFTDSMAIGLSLLAVTFAAKPHIGSMTFGYHRAEVLAALANGLALSAISVWVFLEAYNRIFSPKVIDAPLMLYIAMIGLGGNLVIMLILKPHSGQNINIKSAFVHVVYDTVSSVAVIGSALVAYIADIYILDPIVAFVIAGLIARSAYSIVKESAHILLEAAPTQLDINEIIRSIKEIDNKIIDVHDLHVWTISSGMNALSGHVVVHDQMLSQSTLIIDNINRILLERFGISHTTLQIEPETHVSFKRGL